MIPHIIATAQGLFLTRSVRRLVEQDRWNLDRCGEVTLCPWEHGFASLGGKLIVNKRVVPPQAVAPTSQAPNPGDELGSDPSTSNGDSSSEGGDDPGHPGEPGEAGTEEAPLMRSRQAGSHSDASMSPVRDPASWCPIRLCRLEQASQQPRRWHRVCQRNPCASKAPRVMQRICRVECAAICQIGDQWYEHEDEEVDWAFTYQDLDDLQDYDEGFDDADREELDLSEIESKLIFPRTSEHEPWLSSEEMSELDRLADEFELARLGGMKVFASA